MTKQDAINELTRAAELCPTTPLAEACRMGVALMSERRNCGTCRYAAKLQNDEPCCNCHITCGDKWEPKEVDNGKTD